MNKIYYYISNSDNLIHKTDALDLCKIEEKHGEVIIEILTSENEVIDVVNGYESLGDLWESINGGGNDLE